MSSWILGQNTWPERSPGEPLQVQVQGGGVLHQVGGRQCVLVLEEQVVHLPEPALGPRRFRGLGRELRVRVHVDQRELAEHDGQRVRQVLLQLLHDP
jgi:hypothetical protein